MRYCCLPKWLLPFSLPPAPVILHPIQGVVWYILDYCHSNTYMIVSHYLICNFLMTYEAESLVYVCLALVYIFWRDVQIFCLFLKLGCWFSHCWIIRGLSVLVEEVLVFLGMSFTRILCQSVVCLLILFTVSSFF